MQIGILGAGNVGQVLGSGFAKLGHDVKIGSRDPSSEKLKLWVDKNGKAPRQEPLLKLWPSQRSQCLPHLGTEYKTDKAI